MLKPHIKIPVPGAHCEKGGGIGDGGGGNNRGGMIINKSRSQIMNIMDE